MKSLLRTSQVQALLARVLGLYLAIALRTTRWTVHGREHFDHYGAGTPAVFAFWHEFLPLISKLVLIARTLPLYRPTPIYTLVSHHRDGRFIGTVVRRFGIEPIFGSTSRGGAAGLRSLALALARGGQIGITPDGPRGPRRQAAPGVAQLAALAGVPVLPCAARTSRRIQLRTWDRMALPLPFGRGVLVCGPAIFVSRDDWQAAVPAITAALNQVADQADALCPA
ncbi:lysophospholipid acyltransferase family protein [Rhodopila globiformis]|uniref:DUF374 domain-containing protein n=1 Tax=Rhodopila globiformis TaxID=1071 RepID=A0A2S6MYI8_RHOGL|nr:lysophospholipid acyltransferase family protein [Rhodopila globiformis]PPQ27433.1 hypothetical protein CCS01_27150 [Rhodopila globiformis]